MLPAPSLQIGGCHSGLGPLTALASRTVFPPNGCTKGSTCCCLPERVWAFWTDWNPLCVQHQPKASPPQFGIPEPLGQVQVGAPNPLAWAVTSLSDCPVPSHLPRIVGKSHWPQCLGCPQILPATLSTAGLGTGLSSSYFPHSMKMPGVLLYTDLQSWIFFISGCLTVYGPQLPMAPWLLMTMADRMTQPFDLIIKESHGHQCPPMGI